jgi:hypothetical protein
MVLANSSTRRILQRLSTWFQIEGETVVSDIQHQEVVGEALVWAQVTGVERVDAVTIEDDESSVNDKTGSLYFLFLFSKNFNGHWSSDVL